MFHKAHRFGSFGWTALGITCSVVSLSAAAATPPPPPPNDVIFMTTGDSGCGPMLAGEPVTAAVEPRADTVKNAPYSGVGTTEVITTLADGNRIVRNNTMRYYRDSQGRTRTEYLLTAIGPFTPDQAQTLITISDPVAGARYVLHSALKRADVFKAAGPGGAGMPGGGPTVFYKHSAIAGAGESGVVTSIDPVGGVALAPPVAVMSGSVGMPPANTAFFIKTLPPPGDAADGCKAVRKALPAPVSLGERTIEGLKVTGSRREFTIEAGSIGNEQPIVVRSDQWFSPELGVVVSSTHHDPMMGDTSYKLEQITRAEPDPALFAVPADYSKQEIPVLPPVKVRSSPRP